MAWETVHFDWPRTHVYFSHNTPRVGVSASGNIDAAGETVGNAIWIPSDGTIDKIGAHVGAHTTTGDVDCRIETVGADGYPTGTLKSANANLSQSVTATGWTEWTLSSTCAVTRGDQVAVLFVAGAGTVPDLSFSRFVEQATNVRPQPLRYTGGAWVQPAARALSLSPAIAKEVRAIMGILPSASDALILLVASRPSMSGS